MTNPDKPVTPPPSQKPQSNSAKGSNKAGSSMKISSASQGLISVFILAFGLAAVAAVGYLAYSRYTSPQPQSIAGQSSPAAQDTDIQSQAAEQPESKTAPDSNNLSKASLRQFTGNWAARSGSQTVYATLRADKTFEIVAFMDREGYERRYSKGTFTYDEDQGILNLKAGYDPLPEVEGARIKTLTRRSYNIIPLVDKSSGALVWVPQSMGASAQAAHPAFALLGRSGSYIVWSQRK